MRWALFTFFSLAFCLYLYVGVLARRRLRFAAELLLVFFLLGILWVHINLQANPLTFLLFLELLVGAFFLVVVYAAVLPRSEGCETSATSAATLRTLVVFL